MNIIIPTLDIFEMPSFNVCSALALLQSKVLISATMKLLLRARFGETVYHVTEILEGSPGVYSSWPQLSQLCLARQIIVPGVKLAF